MLKKSTAIALTALITASLMPPLKTQANPAAVIGAVGCGASGVCGAIVGLVTVGGVAYYVINNQGKQSRVRRAGFQINAYPRPQAGPRPNFNTQPANGNGKVEIHGATTAAGCDRMAARFKRYGRRVKLVKKVRLDTGGILQWACHFEGEDATPGWYEGRGKRGDTSSGY